MFIFFLRILWKHFLLLIRIVYIYAALNIIFVYSYIICFFFLLFNLIITKSRRHILHLFIFPICSFPKTLNSFYTKKKKKDVHIVAKAIIILITSNSSILFFLFPLKNNLRFLSEYSGCRLFFIPFWYWWKNLLKNKIT